MHNKSASKKGFTHFELVLLVIVVALIASAGLYIFNYSRNQSKANAPILDKTDPLFNMSPKVVSGINTQIDYYGCIDNRATSSTKGTVLYYGVVQYPGSKTRPSTPNVTFHPNSTPDDPTSNINTIPIDYDLQFGRNYGFYVTQVYYWVYDSSIPGINQNGVRTAPYSVFIKDTSGAIVHTGTVNLASVKTPCPDWAKQSVDTIKNPSSTKKPKKPQKSPTKSKTPTTTNAKPTSSTGGTTPGQQPAPKTYPMYYNNFTRVHHMYKKLTDSKGNLLKDSSGETISKPSNYDVFWTDSKKTKLVVQYRVNIFPGSNLRPGYFYSTVYNADPFPKDKKYTAKSVKIASFRVTNPVGASEYSSPLKNADAATIKANIYKSTAIQGRYWGQAEITKAQMKGKNILYFNTGYGYYDPKTKVTYRVNEPSYKQSQAVNVNNVGWLNNKPGERQPMIRTK